MLWCRAVRHRWEWAARVVQRAVRRWRRERMARRIQGIVTECQDLRDAAMRERRRADELGQLVDAALGRAARAEAVLSQAVQTAAARGGTYEDDATTWLQDGARGPTGGQDIEVQQGTVWRCFGCIEGPSADFSRWARRRYDDGQQCMVC